MRKERLLISACLLGANCKYSGGSNRLPEEVLVALHERYFLLPVCPETAGGLGVPRTASERRGERVVSRTGADVTAAYRAGAQVACRLCERFRCRRALLKERSPSCGRRPASRKSAGISRPWNPGRCTRRSSRRTSGFTTRSVSRKRRRECRSPASRSLRTRCSCSTDCSGKVCRS